MKRIKELDPHTINQMAAGEVVESPASVVKELVDNSIDAEAKLITIEVVDGGFTLIKITDDGLGFHPEDLKICLKKHTTSKLETIDDLFNLATMGFRGEALASIAAIAELSIASKSSQFKDQPHGYRLTHIPHINVQPFPIDQGTVITVRSLFYNVPARKAFQKTPAHALSDVVKIVTKFALAFPHVSFRLVASSQEVLSHRALTDGAFVDILKGAIEATLGPAFLKGAFPVAAEEKGIRVRGVLGGFDQVRSQRTGQHLFINQRAIQSPYISQVIKSAYGTRIDSAMHPTCVLHIDLPYDSVDINVHPQKKEVRIKNEKEILEVVKKILIKALLVPNGEPSLKDAQSPPSQSYPSPLFNRSSAYAWSNWESPEPLKKAQLQVFNEPDREENVDPVETFTIVGRLFHYLIIPSDQLRFFDDLATMPLTLVDSHALRDKLYYELLKRQVEEVSRCVPLQALLFPITITFDRAQAMKVENELLKIERFGIQLHQVAPTTFQVSALQEGILEGEVKEWVEAIIEHADGERDEIRKEQLMMTLAAKKRKAVLPMETAELIEAIRWLKKSSEKVPAHRGQKIFHPISLAMIEKVLR